MDSIVPATPSGLCFTREKFTKNGFSADSFLQDLWNSVPLEILRDDLGAYLKVLRSAMIELINRDYADFVNLSSNLVGLDKAITNLQEPLSVIHSEILAVEKVLNDAHDKLQFTLSERQAIREKKMMLECLMKIPHCLSHLEKLLDSLSMENVSQLMEDDPTKGNIMERAANEFNHLQHLLVKCSHTEMVVQLKQRIDRVQLHLMKCLEDSLIYGIEQQKRDVLQKTLYTFVLLDQCKFAENLIRTRIIHPAVQKLLNENALKMEPRDLQGLLLKVKDFIRQQLKDLIDISTSFEGPHDFNVIVNCLWPVICLALVEDLDCIFDYRNPDLLHKRYCCTMEFLEYLACLSSSPNTQLLTNDSNYQVLRNRWNLPVYFQMRFQDVAGDVETSLAKPFDEYDGDKSIKPVYLKSTAVLWDSLSACFAADIYLVPLAHRFWKLCLQIMARYCFKINGILQEQMKRCESVPVASLVPSSSSSRLADLEASNSAPGSGLQHSVSTPRLSSNGEPSLSQLVHLDSDIRRTLKEFPSVWDAAWKRLEQLGVENRDLFERSFQRAVKEFEDLLPKITQFIVGELCLQCSAQLRNVSDIPRLYRRTNKEVPTKCFAYVNQLLSPLIEFRNRHHDQSENMDLWTRGVLENIARQYLVAVSDVLTSVQKTEESLKRLRKDRVTAASTGVTDDDKIRMQLVIDVDAFVEQSTSLLSDTSAEIGALRDVVEPARLVFRRSPSASGNH